MSNEQQQGNNLDSWLDAYAARAETLAVSEVRALFSVVSRPEVVSLAGGMPYVIRELIGAGLAHADIMTVYGKGYRLANEAEISQ